MSWLAWLGVVVAAVFLLALLYGWLEQLVGRWNGAPQPGDPWDGKFRVVRIETNAGRITFCIQRWNGKFWEDGYSSFLGPQKRIYPTSSDAAAAIDGWLADEHAKAIKSETVVIPAENPPIAKVSTSPRLPSDPARPVSALGGAGKGVGNV